MKITTLALIAALAAAPVGALAQQQPPPGGMGGPGMGGPGMGGPSTQQMQQMRQMHLQARGKMLAALTPAHKALLAKVVGDLAVAETPNEAAAAKQLDAALSPAEKTAIVNAHADMMKQAQSMMGAQGAGMGNRMWRGKNMTDPGAMLLMLSMPMHPMGGPPPR